MKKDLYVGIDLGGTSAKIGLVNSDGDIMEKVQIKTIKSENWKEITDEFLKPVEKWLSNGLEIKGVGIGTPGSINKKTLLLHNCANIPGLMNAPFANYIKDKLKLNVVVDNDGTCAAVGEHAFGAAKDFEDFVMVTIGTGIGGGLVLNNEVFRGTDGYAGELGHIIVVAEGRSCTCGNRGCVEAYSSATAMIQRVKDGIKKGFITSYNDVKPEEINARMIFEKAQAGDAYSLDTVDNAARYLGRMLGGIINLLNLEAIVIGGGVAQAGNFFIDKVDFYTKQVAWYSFTHNLQVIPAKLLNDAGILGAAALTLPTNK